MRTEILWMKYVSLMYHLGYLYRELMSILYSSAFCINFQCLRATYAQCRFQFSFIHAIYVFLVDFTARYIDNICMVY
jgi:hypothetical protein